MGVSALWFLGAAAVGSAVSSADTSRKARHSAEDQARLQREALAELQAEPEPEIPLADSSEVRQARRRSIAAQMRRRGRASTILTDTGTSDRLGS